MRGQGGRKAAQNFRRDVCKRDIGRDLSLADEVGALYGTPVGNAVKHAVVLGAVRRNGVDISQVCALCTQKDGRYAQNTASAAHVEADALGREILLQELQTHGGSLVLTRAERHIAVQPDGHLLRLFFILYPLGHDDHAAADVNGTEVFAPYLYPVVALYRARGYLERAERHAACAIFFHFLDIGAYLRHICGRILDGDEGLYERLARVMREILVHIVPIHDLIPLQGDDVLHVGDGHAVI